MSLDVHLSTNLVNIDVGFDNPESKENRPNDPSCVRGCAGGRAPKKVKWVICQWVLSSRHVGSAHSPLHPDRGRTKNDSDDEKGDVLDPAVLELFCYSRSDEDGSRRDTCNDLETEGSWYHRRLQASGGGGRWNGRNTKRCKMQKRFEEIRLQIRQIMKEPDDYCRRCVSRCLPVS